MRFQVPQFIEVESKLFGPLTIKQFIYLAGGIGLIFLLYVFLPLFLAVLFGIPILIFSLALAFYKVNNQPFVKVMENALNFFLSTRVYTWKKKSKPIKSEIKFQKAERRGGVYVPKLNRGRLEDLAWSLDIKERIR